MNYYQRFLQKMAQTSNRQKEINKLVAESNKHQQQAKKINQKADKDVKHHTTKAKKYDEGYKTNLAKADIEEEATRQHGNAIKNLNQPKQTNRDTPEFKINKIKFHKDK